MDFSAFLESLERSRYYRGQIVHVETLPARQARWADFAKPLPAPLADYLARLGIERLYSHQVEAIEHVRAGRDVVVVTSTASGKTLCYNLPVVRELLGDPARPRSTSSPPRPWRRTSSSARDLAGISRPTMRASPPGTYDGDTPA